MSQCPYCQSPDDIEEEFSQEPFQYRGQELFARQSYSYCLACELEFESAEQTRYNRCQVSEAKRLAGGLLSGKEIEAARKQLGLTQAQAAEVFGGGRHAFSKYERGEVIQSTAMDRLVRLCLRHPELLRELSDY